MYVIALKIIMVIITAKKYLGGRQDVKALKKILE